jgi:hypothetical protein
MRYSASVRLRPSAHDALHFIFASFFERFRFALECHGPFSHRIQHGALDAS